MARIPRPSVPLATLREAQLGEACLALAAPGAIVLLIGEAGSGRHVLAQQAISSVGGAEEGPTSPDVVTLNASATVQEIPFALLRAALPQAGATAPADIPDAAAGYSAVIAAWPARAGGTIFLVDDADSADELTLQVIAAAAGALHYRVVITARSLTALPLPVAQLLREKPVTVIELPPLDHTQSAQLTCHLLSPHAVEAETISRLHRVSGGNPLFLTELIASLQRSGALTRFDDLVSWTSDSTAPASLPEFLVRELSRTSPTTRSALLTIALAEPIPVSALATIGDIATPEAIDSLLEHRVLREVFAPDGSALLRTSNQLIGDTVRQAIPPGQRIRLLRRISETLPAELLHAPAETLLRGTVVLLDAGRLPSTAILWRALELARATNNYRLAVRIGRLLGADNSLSERDRIEATTARLSAARFSGVAEFLSEPDILLAPSPRGQWARPTDDDMVTILPAPRDSTDTVLSRIRLGLARADILLYRDDDVAGARAILDRLLSVHTDPASAAYQLVVTGAYVRLAYAGEFTAARGLRDLPGAPRRAPEAIPVAGADILIAGQSGELRATRAIARHTLPAALARSAEYPTAGGEIFGALFMSEVLHGQAASAGRLHRALLRGVEHPTAAYREGTGLIGVITGTLALVEGRWVDAAAELAASIDALSRSDGTGFLPVALAARAHALAAGGRSGDAQETLSQLEHTSLRASRVFEGPIRLASVMARLWLEDPSAQEAAELLGDWAGRRDFSLIELRAIHLASLTPAPVTASTIARAEMLSERIGTRFATALATVVSERASGGPVLDTPAVRRLARHGVLAPFGWRVPLTPRERETAGLAVLGYSTKRIAARLGISTRTVEAHLAQVFIKVGVNDREGLSLHLEQRGSLWAPTRSAVFPEDVTGSSGPEPGEE